jgi:hypothetical protein
MKLSRKESLSQKSAVPPFHNQSKNEIFSQGAMKVKMLNDSQIMEEK